MQYTLKEPDLPSVARWISLSKRFPRQSTLRMLEYEALEKVQLKGTVLDIGGGDKSKYRQSLGNEIEYSSVNIDPSINPTWLTKPGEKLPIENNMFDTCISLNTLEHVYDPKFLIGEILRVLKPGGCAYITVPWIFRIHAHPDDYGRYTPSWWRQTCENAGFSEMEILPLIWGRYSTGASITGIRGLSKLLSNTIVHVKDVMYANLTIRGTNGKYSGSRAERICAVAPGYFIKVVK